MHFLIQTKSRSSAWNRLSTVSKLNQVISQRVLKRQNFSNSQISKSADTSCRNLMQIPTLIGITSLQEKIASKNRHHGFKPDSHFFFLEPPEKVVKCASELR